MREEVREKMIGLLPEWWSNEKAEQCVPAGRNGGWTSLSKKIAKEDAMSHFDDGDMPMQQPDRDSATFAAGRITCVLSSERNLSDGLRTAGRVGQLAA